MSKNKGLNVRWEPNCLGGSERFTWEELGCNDEAEWHELNDQDQAERIEEALNNIYGLCFAQAASINTY